MGDSSETSSNSSVVIRPVELSNSKYGSVPLEIEEQDQIKLSIEETKKDDKLNKMLDHLISTIGLVLATYVGVISRIYLSFFSQWDGIQHFPSIWAQLVGTFIIGLLIAQKDILQKNFKIVYISLSTGFCGSLTTFSSWNAEASIVLLHLNETSLSPSQIIDQPTGRIVGFLTVLILGVGVPLSAALLGRNIGIQLLLLYSSATKRFNIHAISCLANRKWLILIVVIICYVLVTTAIVASCTMTNNYSLMFSLLFGGFGTYLRWRLSYFDTRLRSGFPFGTFLANSIGSMILAGTIVSKAYVAMETTAGQLVSAALVGMATGFCGSLTTVSTFVSQLCSLPFRIAALYSIVSLLSAQIIFALVLGIYSWTKF